MALYDERNKLDILSNLLDAYSDIGELWAETWIEEELNTFIDKKREQFQAFIERTVKVVKDSKRIPKGQLIAPLNPKQLSE